MTIERNSQGESCGEFSLHPDFTSKYVQPRNVNIWLPSSYGMQSDRQYRVIYAHDGQNLFNPKTSYSGVDWGLHETLCRMMTAGEVRDTLVVGIWNTPERYREYDPQRVFEEYLDSAERAAYAEAYGHPVADRYLKFIVRELKPFIDSNFRTLPGRDDTLLLGSSMGGLISAYALCEYPEVFGGAACLSTHWPAGHGRMNKYLDACLPEPGTHRFYFDFGTETIDAQYETLQREVDLVMQRRGYVVGDDWLTRKFIGADHSERAWRSRLDIPLRFLLS